MLLVISESPYFNICFLFCNEKNFFLLEQLLLFFKFKYGCYMIKEIIQSFTVN